MTLGHKLSAIKLELAAVVRQLNESDDPDIALEAQNALCVVNAVLDSLANRGLDDLEFAADYVVQVER